MITPSRSHGGGRSQKNAQLIKQCYYCVNNKLAVDYKDVGTLRRFVSSYMKVAPRRRSGLCARHQRASAKAIKRARQGALMPYIAR